MNKSGLLKHIDFQLIEIASLILSFFVALAFRGLVVKTMHQNYMTLIIFELLINICIAYFYGPFKDILKRTGYSVISHSLAYDGLQLLFVTLFLFMIKGSEDISRLFLFYEYITYFIFSSICKIVWRRYLRRASKTYAENGNKALLIVTNKSRLDGVIKDIDNKNFDGNKILGLCVLDDDNISSYDRFNVACHKNDLLSYACNNWVDGVYFDLPYNDIPKDIIESLSIAGITTHIEISGFVVGGYNTYINKILGNSVITISVKERSNRQIFFKGVMDLIGGIIGCIVTLILIIIIGPIIKIKSPGPIFYKQERIGLNGRHFYMWKFRSMIPNADRHLEELKDKNRVSSDLMFKMNDDPRIIPGIGEFIRKTSLDEFPQFFNVLLGDMSLVGTRPPTVDEWNKYELKHRIRMSTKPGITGMWQTSGRSAITDFDEVVKLDAKYINEWTLGLDVKLILQTVFKLFKTDNDEAM